MKMVFHFFNILFMSFMNKHKINLKMYVLLKKSND